MSKPCDYGFGCSETSFDIAENQIGLHGSRVNLDAWNRRKPLGQYPRVFMVLVQPPGHYLERHDPRRGDDAQLPRLPIDHLAQTTGVALTIRGWRAI